MRAAYGHGQVIDRTIHIDYLLILLIAFTGWAAGLMFMEMTPAQVLIVRLMGFAFAGVGCGYLARRILRRYADGDEKG